MLEGHVPDDHARHLERCAHCQTVVAALSASDPAWQDMAAELRRPAPALPAAGRAALEAVKRFAITPPRSDPNPHPLSEESTVTARIHVERMMHRGSIAVPGESAAAYTLVKLIPSGLNGATRPLGLNLALALDVSGSMYEEDGTGKSRLQRVQDAALDALQKLRPADTLALIGFAHNSRVLLPPTPVAAKDRIEDVLRRIDTFDIDPGGTAMDEGLALALAGLPEHAGDGRLSQVVVLTDGETSGEQQCRALARQAAVRKIPVTLMGVGLDWKADLFKDLANLSQGKWYYIDTAAAQETTRVFAEEFATLAATAFLDVELHVRPVKDVCVKRLRQVVPEIREVKLEEPEERHLVARLGALPQGVSGRYIFDLGLPARADGKYALAQLEVTYDPGTGRRESSGQIALEMTYTAAGNGPANAEVMKHIDEIRFQELSDDFQKAVERNDKPAARQLGQELEETSKQIGNVRKTMLVRQALDELNAEGRVRKQTRLQMDDVAREGE
jgi:Ca-activated chloride channel family protein